MLVWNASGTESWNANWNATSKCKFEMQVELQIWNAYLKCKLKCNVEMQNWNAILQYSFNMQV